MGMLLQVLVGLLMFPAVWVNTQKLQQSPQSLTIQEGDELTMSCNSSSSLYALHWYRQGRDGGPIFLVTLQKGGDEKRKDKITAKLDKKMRQSFLSIQASQPSYAGTYLCAGSARSLEGYEYYPATDKLIFGQGTQVTVEPKKQPPAKPSVFIMKNGTNVACLVKDFYPKDVNISLRSSKKIAEFDPAIAISPSGKYSAVKLGQYGDSNSVTCSVQHNSETVHSTDFEQYADSVDNVKPTEPAKNDTQTSEPCHSPRVMIHAKKVNTMSLTVLGLRLLLAKTVAINFLLTAKLFF
nr:Similar to T cell receptor V delta 6 [Rattus norvegicus]